MPRLELDHQKCIDLINKYDISTHKKFIELYKQEYGHTFTQSSFARRFKEFHIVKVEGVYKYLPEKIDSEGEIQRLLFNHCNYIAPIHNNYYLFVIKCDIGTESIICKLIYEKFNKKIRSIIPGYGSIVIIFRKKDFAKEIKEYIKKHIRNKNDKEDD